MNATPTIKAGDFVIPDGWDGWGGLLTDSDWDTTEFRIETNLVAGSAYTPTNSGYVELAVNVAITGRELRRIPRGAGWGYRVKITYPGDGEPDQTDGGWVVPR